MVEAIKRGFPQREIADAAFRYQQEVDSGSGSSSASTPYRLEDDEATEIHRPDPAPSASRRAARGDRARRDAAAVEAALAELEGRRGDDEQPDAAAPRRGAGAGLGGRDGRRAPGGLRDLHRAAGSCQACGG